MLNENIFELMEDLEYVSLERKRLRRKLFRLLRIYYSKGEYRDYWLERKMRLNFLKDLSDKDVGKWEGAVCADPHMLGKLHGHPALHAFAHDNNNFFIQGRR